MLRICRKSLSEACSNFYRKKPSNIIAVTGTNGKSSVVNFFYQILEYLIILSASIGTLGIFYKNYKKKTNLTSIDPLSLHKSLQIIAKKINNVILEASSHGLDQKRLDNLKINTGIFTNLSHDHLDYHKNMKSYFNSKMYLFSGIYLKKIQKLLLMKIIKNLKLLKKLQTIQKIKKITIGSKSGNIKILQ